MFKSLSKVGQREEVSRKIFSERELILNGSEKSLNTLKRKKKEYKLANFSDIQREIKKVINQPEEVKSEIVHKPSAVFNSSSRVFSYSTNNSPPVGAYDINYKSVQKNVSIPKFLYPQTRTICLLYTSPSPRDS